MKRIIFSFIGVVVLLGIVASVAFYRTHLRSIWPAFGDASGDITDYFPDTSTTTSTPRQGSGQADSDDIPLSVTTTDFPLQLPIGFSLSLFAKNLGKARAMMFGPGGALLVSDPDGGRVIGLLDRNGDGTADAEVTVAKGLNRPHGLAMRCPSINSGQAGSSCKLYIAETNQVARYDIDDQTLLALNKQKLFDLPAGGNHYTRTLLFRPAPYEDELLVSVGSTCNVCVEGDWRRASVLSARYDGTDLKAFATGLRNAVFMAIHPVTGAIWVTEMGRDWLGDDLPPDEINVIQNPIPNFVPNFGWPICYGKNIHDTDFDKNTYIRNPCMEPFETPSHIDIPAHSAPLGLAFFPEDPPSHEASDGRGGWPEEYWYDLLVAYHGSWNRSEPTGYKVVRYRLDEYGNYLGEEDFMTGWLTDKGALGRPVDIKILPGGVIYISDDKAGVIYRVTYQG